MPNKDFTVKNGLVVNTAFSANSSGVYFSNVLLANSTQVNATTFTGTANNTSFVGTVSAANVVSNAQLSSNLANYVTTTNLTNNLSNYQTTAGLNANIASYLPTYSGVVNGATFSVGSSWTANSTRVVFGTSVGIQANGSLGTANQVLTTNGSSVYWANGGGTGSTYTKGNQGAIGDASAANNIFRINANTISNNITISTGENASATGPITVNEGYTFTVDTDGRAVII